LYCFKVFSSPNYTIILFEANQPLIKRKSRRLMRSIGLYVLPSRKFTSAFLLKK